MENSLVIPDQTSNAGPDAVERNDWRDWLYVAEESAAAARRMECNSMAITPSIRNQSRISAIDSAINALLEAKEQLTHGC